MELTELVDPHVAMPVLGVVVCAIMVFAFGFRSPVQPPSFNFEEERRNKKRSKTTKVKAPTNGHVVVNEPPSEKTSPKPVRESKPASSPKTKAAEGKVNKKDNKTEKTEAKQDKKDKVKKIPTKDEKPLIVKKETEDDGEWTTIQGPKKSKKQQKPIKKDGGHADAAVDSEIEPEATPVLEAAAAASSVETAADVDGNDFSQVTKKDKKKKKEKVVVKGKDVEAETEKPPPVAEAQVVEDKKKKSKKEKKNDGGAAAAAGAAPSDAPPQEAAPASAKAVKKEKEAPQPTPAPAPADEAKTTPKKKKKSKDNDEKATTETKPEAKSTPKKTEPKVEKQTEPKVTKQAETKAPAKAQEAADSKSAPKQPETPKKSKKKETSEKPVSSAPKEDPVASQPEAKSEPKMEADTAAPTPVTFDEMGDVWQEAAPKSKKKRPRRDN